MNARHVSMPAAARRHRAHGFTMVELMIAMLLGLIVIAGVSSVFLANLRSYKSNTALGDVQSNSRIAFELMARDIRQAGLTGCNSLGSDGIKDVRIGNVLKNGPYGGGTPPWWADWVTGTSAVVGYASSVVDPAIVAPMPARAASTDSLMVMEAEGQGLAVASTSADSFTFSDAGSDIQTGDIIIVCNPDHATIMQATGYDAASRTITHAVDVGTPGNCADGLNYLDKDVTTCESVSGDYPLGRNSKISKLAAHDWYIGVNPAGGRSLYRVALTLDADGAPKPEAQEMVRNVTGMQIDYHVSGDAKFVSAAAVSASDDWASVDAVHIAFTVQSADQRAGVNAKPLTRTFASTVSIRNRM